GNCSTSRTTLWASRRTYSSPQMRQDIKNLMCNTLLCLRSNKTIHIQGRTPHLEIEKYGHGMREHLTNQAVLVMPQVVHAYALHGKTFRQMCAHGFDQLPPPPTGFE